ncbi:hypothetical protein BG004_000316, partial [Podila humilis]
RNSSFGHITAGTGGLPSTHTASILASSKNNNSSNGIVGNTSTNSNGASSASSSSGFSNNHSNSRRFSTSHPLHPQHRTQSVKARLGRMCPTLVHGTSRRQRSALMVLCAGGVIVLIYFVSSWEVKLSSRLVPRSSSSYSYSSNGGSGYQQIHSQNNLAGFGNHHHGQTSNEPVVYKNPDGTEMDSKAIFLARDFGSKACKATFALAEQHLPSETKEERAILREETWKRLSKNDTYSLSLAWKRSLKQILPNWKNYITGWIGQGVVLTAFRDGDGKDVSENLKVQIRLIRSMSSIPIEVWFEYATDVTEELHELIVTFGGIIRILEHDTSNSSHASVEVTDQDAVINLGSETPPIRPAELEEFKSRIRDRNSGYNNNNKNNNNNKGQIQKALTIASLINSGFEEIIYFSPSVLPMQSPRHLFQQSEYVKTGALFWQHPTSPPTHDSPIWPIIQADCVTSSYEQSMSSFVLKHKDSWKGLYLAWYWLTGQESSQFEKIIGHQGNDLLRLAWIAVRRPYAMVDKMPAIGLEDQSGVKGDGIGCNLGSHLYPAPQSPVLIDHKSFIQQQKKGLKLLLQKNKDSSASAMVENQNVMFIDTSAQGLVHAGSNDRHLHSALDQELKMFKDMTRLLGTDSYVGGSDDRVCLRVHQRQKGLFRG